MTIDDSQVELYSRQIILRELGGVAQRRLLEARCLACGGGPALESALGYLAGAGLGAIDLSPAPGASADTLGLAPLAERSPDVRLRTLPSAPGSLEEYDVCLLCDDRAAAAAVLRGSAGRPRHGAIAVSRDADGDLHLLLVPRHAGCPSCVTYAPGGDGARPAAASPCPPEASALALAGTMAALAACRWLTGIGGGMVAGAAEGPRALRLARGTALWEDGALERAPRCSRGCPPPGRAL